jgi:hypothetical protein
MVRSRIATMLVLATLLSASCSGHVAQIQTLKLPRQNPTTYEFDYPLNPLHQRVIDVFSMEHQVREPVFGKPDLRRLPASSPVAAIFRPEDLKNTLFGKDILDRPGNEADIFLNCYHEPLWESPVYRGTRTGLEFFAEFHLHLVAVRDNRTRISVTAVKTEVTNGAKFGFGHSGPTWYPVREAVPPTTVEEYVILRYIGQSLGTQGMPDIALPKSR